MDRDGCPFKKYNILVKIWEKHLIYLHQEMRSLEAKWNLQCHLGKSEIEN